MQEATKFIAIWVGKHCKDNDELFEHLSMNGYTFDVATSNEGYDTLFVFEDEAEYVFTILNDRSFYYEVK